MKSLLINIQPKRCEKIAKREETIEVQKTRPKEETPFKCYIYCTKGENLWLTQKGVKSKTERQGCRRIWRGLSTFQVVSARR